MTESVCERLFREGAYKNYVVSTTLRKQQFLVENGDRLEILWPIYVYIFGNSNFNRTRGHMSRNTYFLNELMQRKSFVSMQEESRKILSRVKQNAESIRDVMTYGNAFAIEYFSSMAGFVDRDAAVAFLDVVEGSPQLLAADSIYDNVHDKLVDPRLKARYTRRKKAYA